MLTEEILLDPVKILLVDDKESNLISLQSILQEDNYMFRNASSGEEALHILLKETDFTLIIMDVIMPGMDGFQTASYIAERDKLRDIPILFLTANDQDKQIFTAYQMGAVDYISKPMIPDLLRAKVKVFVELSLKNRKLQQQTHQLKEMNSQLAREIKERKASEDKVKKLNDELSKKLDELESLDSFSYSVSHDLKNPITSISLLLELLMNHEGAVLDDEGKEYVQRSQSQIKRVENIVNDLLLFSRHGNDITKKEVNMNDIVKGVMEDIKLHYGVNGRHQIEIDPLPPAKCDSGLIKQVWSNLISNAVKYSNKRERPAIKVEVMERDNKQVFVVRDNGIGMDPGNSENVFKVFYRTDSAKKDFEGNGVGLAIVKRIIDKHGGQIWFESEPDKGTAFFFTLDE